MKRKTADFGSWLVLTTNDDGKGISGDCATGSEIWERTGGVSRLSLSTHGEPPGGPNDGRNTTVGGGKPVEEGRERSRLTKRTRSTTESLILAQDERWRRA